MWVRPSKTGPVEENSGRGTSEIRESETRVVGWATSAGESDRMRLIGRRPITAQQLTWTGNQEAQSVEMALSAGNAQHTETWRPPVEGQMQGRPQKPRG